LDCDGGIERVAARTGDGGLARASKGLVDKGDCLCGIVHADAEFASPCAAHDLGLDLFRAKVVEGLDVVEEDAYIDGAVDLGERKEGRERRGRQSAYGKIVGTE
jgi:hypothetical protein